MCIRDRITGFWLEGMRTTEVGSRNLPVPTLRPPPERFLRADIVLCSTIVIIVTIITVWNLVYSYCFLILANSYVTWG